MTENLDIPKSKLHRIILMTTLNSFGMGFVSIFIPVYLLEIGYSIKMVMYWYIIEDCSFILLSYFSVYCSNKLGLVQCLQLRFLFLISSLVSVYYVSTLPNLFYFTPILIGLEMAFFWIPLNILITRNTHDSSMGESLGKLSAYPKMLSIFCPVIGAYIVVHFGFQVLFVFAMFIVFTAFFPLWPLRSEKTNFKFTAESVKNIWFNNKKYFIPEVVSSFAETGWLILTIFIYIKLLSVTQIGFVGTIATLSGVFFTISIGKIADKWNKHKLMKISAVIASGIWIYCFYIGNIIPNPWLFYIATFALTMVVKAFIVPYQSILFNGARKDDAQFLVLREIPNIIGRLLLYTLAIILSSNLSLVFLVSATVFVYFWFFDSTKLVTAHAST